MKPGGTHTPSVSGFTIVETMIVLAVTGLLFLSAATLISGKEAQVQFTTSIRNAQTQIQQVIGEVQSGFYPNNSDITCAPNRPHQTLRSTGNGTTTQGTNTGCIFLGKALQFGQGLGANDLEPVTVYTISGNQLDPSGQEVASLANAYPTVVTDATQTFTLHYGLRVVCIAEFSSSGNPGSPCTGAGNTPAVVAFLSSLGSLSSSGDLLSGSQNVDIYPVSGTRIGDADDTNTINNNLKSSTALGTFDPPKGIGICFQSGTTKQSGLITIGGSSNGQLAVNLQIFSSRDCT